MNGAGGSKDPSEEIELLGEEPPSDGEAQARRPNFPWWVPLVLLVAAVAVVLGFDRFQGGEETPGTGSRDPETAPGPGPRQLTGPPTGRFLLSLAGGGAAVSPGTVIGTDLEPIQLSPLGSDLFLAVRPTRVGPTGRELGGWLELAVQGAELAEQGAGGDPAHTTIVRRDWEARLIRARWSPLGERVAYLAHGGSICTREMDDIDTEDCADVDGVAAVAASGGRLAWAPDGERLLLDGDGIREVDVETGEVSRLVPEGGGPAVRDEVGEVRALPVAGWSPSGRYAAASAMLTGGGYYTGFLARDVPVVFDDEGELAAVGREDPARAPSVAPRWSPTEDRLAYAVGGGDTDGDGVAERFAVFLLNPSTGESREVHAFGSSDARGVIDLEWSPDGEHLAVVRGARSDGPDAGMEIWIVDPSGGGPTGVIDASLISLAAQNPIADWGPTVLELTPAQRRLAEQRGRDLDISAGEYVVDRLERGL